jgi:phosphogluconate dehydratase
VVVVIREQGPSANGMPELHALTPSLGVLQKRGYAVALVTDGRMSGASGAIPAAIHVTPESVHAGPISKIRDGDVVRVDSLTGRLDVVGDEQEFAGRLPSPRITEDGSGTGRELFAAMRATVGRADEGAHVFSTQSRAHLAGVHGGSELEDAYRQSLPQEEDIR